MNVPKFDIGETVWAIYWDTEIVFQHKIESICINGNGIYYSDRLNNFDTKQPERNLFRTKNEAIDALIEKYQNKIDRFKNQKDK